MYVNVRAMIFYLREITLQEIFLFLSLSLIKKKKYLNI